MTFPFDLDPHERDPGGWCASLLHSAEILLGCLDAVQARSVAEVGAFMGELTRLLMLWADTVSGTVVAIDPSPHRDLEQLERERRDLQLIRETSHEALAHIPLTDAIILDGDHNYYTLSEELRIIWRRAGEERRLLPLVLLHDVTWPHGLRDDYYVPERIPAEHRQPIAPDRSVYPDEEGTQYSGLPYRYPAANEGGAPQRRANRCRGLRLRARAGAPGGRARVLRAWRDLGSFLPARRRTYPGRGAVGPQPAAGAAGAQPCPASRLIATSAAPRAGRQRARAAARPAAGPDAALTRVLGRRDDSPATPLRPGLLP